VTKGYRVTDFGIGLKDFFTVFVLLFNTFSWLFMTRRILSTILSDQGDQLILVTWGVYDLTLIGSGIVGAVLSSRVRRLQFIYFWMLLGTLASILPSFIPNPKTYVLGISFLWSVALGLGIPSSFAYFAESTDFENRGRISGLIFLAANLSAPFIVLFLTTDATFNFILSTVWRGLGLLILLALKPQAKMPLDESKTVSFISVLKNKTFLLYLLPWLMFSMIDGFEKLFFQNFLSPDLFNLLRMIGALIGTIFAFIGGLLSDLVGRKRIVIYGFVSLGLAYAAVGVASANYISWYFYSVIDGIAWGIFTVTFVLTLWGDLSPPKGREKYYAIGSIPFFLAEFAGLVLVPFMWIPLNAAFSVASLFLFLAVLPLMYAPETLPEKKMEIRRLKGYIEQAKKFTEKYTKKNGNKS
jgi:MFS family permease